MATPSEVAEALGFGPWRHPQEIGRDFSVMKVQLERLQQPNAHGSIPWLIDQLQSLERKVMLRSRTPLPEARDEPVLPPDFWLAPQLAETMATTKRLQTTIQKLDAQVQHMAQLLSIDLTGIGADANDEDISEPSSDRRVRPRLAATSSGNP